MRFNSVLSLSDQVSRGYIAVAGAHVVIASMAPLNELIWTILVQPVFRVMDASYYGREGSSKTIRQISSWQSPSPYRKGRFQMDFHLGIHTFLASALFQIDKMRGRWKVRYIYGSVREGKGRDKRVQKAENKLRKSRNNCEVVVFPEWGFPEAFP